MLKICAYARVSTDSADQANSFESQKSYFTREIQKQNDCEFMGIYADQGITGTILKRPAFDQMIYDAGIDFVNNLYVISQTRKPLFDYIYLKNTSRFARNTLSSAIINALRKNKVYIYFMEQQIDTKNLTQDFMLGLFQLFDQQDSKDRSAKVISGVKEAAKRNRVHTNGKIYGYSYDVPTKTLEIIPEEAEIIKKIFELYDEGLGFRRIYNYLTEHSIFTRSGKIFSKSSLRNIISNEKYKGYNNRLKYNTGIVFEKFTYAKIKDDYVVQKNDNIPVIVEEDLFDRCQAIIKSKSVNSKGNYVGITKYVGLLVCQKCGSNYIGNMDKERRFYNCAKKKKYGVKECNNHNLSLKTLENEIHELCNGKYKTTKARYIDITIFILKDIKESLKSQLDTDVVDIINNKKTEIDKNSTSMDRLLDLYQDAEIEKEEYFSRRKKLIDKNEKLEQEIQALGHKDVNLLKDIETLDRLIEESHNSVPQDKYTEKELLAEIKKIEVQTDGNLFVIDNFIEETAQIIKKYFYIIENMDKVL